MSSFYKKHSLQTISMIVLVALVCNAVVFNVLEKPKIAKALGDEWATIGHFFVKIGDFLWSIGVKLKDWAWEKLKDIWQKKLSSQDWWWERAKDAAQFIARKLQASLLAKITNNLADVIEGKDTLDGFKKYVEDFKKDIFWDAIAEATNQFSQELAGIDLCGPLGFGAAGSSVAEAKAEAKIVINPPLSDRLATTMSCSRKQMGQNLKNFYESFEGGWGSWLNVTQPNQNFAGSYLLALDAKIDLANKNTQANVAKVTANAGWRSNEQCDEWFISKLNLTFSRGSAVSGQLTASLTNQPISVVDYLLRMYADPPTLATFRLAAGVGIKQQEKEAKSTDLTTQADDATLCYNSCRGDNALTPEGIASPNPCSNPQGDRAGFCCYDKIKACRDAGFNEDVLLGNFLGAVCTKKSVKSPGQLIGQSFTKAVNWESDWLLSNTEISSAISILADAAINRFMRKGIDALGKTAKADTKNAPNIFGSDAKAVEANQAACRKRSVALDRNACLRCAYIDPKQLEFQACFNNEKQRLMMAPALTGQINDTNLSADMTQISLLNQAIELKEKVSRALQSMGGASYYAAVRDPLKNLQYLSKCRWQSCAGAEIRNSMILLCNINPNRFNDMVTRNDVKELNFGKATDDGLSAIDECDAKEEKICATKPPLNTTLDALCITKCNELYENQSSRDSCYLLCPPNPHLYKLYPCYTVAKHIALHPHEDLITPVCDILTGAPFLLDSDIETLSDPEIRKQKLLEPGLGTCLSDAPWLTGNKNNDDATGDGGIIGRAEFYQKTPRFAGYDLVPGWWNYEQKITIEQKIKDLAKEIGQDSRLIQIHRDNICGADSVCKTNFGTIDMSYEYADQCMAKCGNPNDEKKTPAEKATAQTCLTKCTQIDVFEKLTPPDITAMFTPYGVADSQTACLKDTAESFENCVKTKMTAACTTHCAKVKQANPTINEESCKTFCNQGQPLGLCNNVASDTLRPGLACTNSLRHARLGSMRIQQWDILAIQEQVNGIQEIQDFLKNTLDVCPTGNNVPAPPAKTDPDYENRIKEYYAALYQYEENVIQKALAEQELSTEAKNYAVDWLNKESKKTFAGRLESNLSPSNCKNIGGFIHDLDGNYDVNLPSDSLRIKNAQLENKDCPVTLFWLLWGTHQPTDAGIKDHGIQSCSNYRTTKPDVTIACPISCRFKFTGDQYRTLNETLDNEAQSQIKALAERSSQTISDGQAFSIDTSLIDKLNSQLKFVNDNMDPRSIKQFNQNIIQALNEESCKARICVDTGVTCECNKDNIKWPGEIDTAQ